MNPRLDRACLLFDQNRHELAENELRLSLLTEPQNPQALALLALCLSERKQYAEATETAERAIAAAPDSPLGFQALASVMNDRNRFKEAQTAIEEALRLDPYNVHAFGTLAQTLIHQKEWQDALNVAESGLEIDAEDVDCANLRAIALVKLGRREEAGAMIDTALGKNPDNPVTHANQGWTLLEQGQPKKAMEHFREALRLDPSNEWARGGIVEALKAQNFIYAIMLKYFLWMARLKPGAQWGVLIGVFLGNRVLGGISDANPDLAPWILPLRILLFSFVVMTWIAGGLFDLLLRCNRFGRLALSREQTVASTWLGVTLFLALVSAGFCVGFGIESAFLVPLVVFGLLLLPVAGAFRGEGWKHRALGFAAIGIALIGVTAVVLAVASIFQPEETKETMLRYSGDIMSAFILSVVIYTWGSSALLSMPDRR
jgi:tetratricopeptide (TPR) repeat protein